MNDDSDDVNPTPPPDWSTAAPEMSWKTVLHARTKAREAREAKRALEAELAKLQSERDTLAKEAGTLREQAAAAAQLRTQLDMARAGIVDEDIADTVRIRYDRYKASEGDKAAPLSEWLAGPAKQDRVLSRLLDTAAPPAPPAAAPAAPQEPAQPQAQPSQPQAPAPPAQAAPAPPSTQPAPVVPSPSAIRDPVRSAYSAEDISQIRAKNGGRLPKEVLAQVPTKVSVSDLFGGS